MVPNLGSYGPGVTDSAGAALGIWTATWRPSLFCNSIGQRRGVSGRSAEGMVPRDLGDGVRSRPRPRQPGRDEGGTRVRRSPGRGNPRCSRLAHQRTTGRCHACVQDALGTSRKRCATTSFGLIVAMDRSIPERRRRGDFRTAGPAGRFCDPHRMRKYCRQLGRRPCRPVGVHWTRADSPRNHPDHVLPLVRRRGLTGPIANRRAAVRSQLMGLSTVSPGNDRR